MKANELMIGDWVLFDRNYAEDNPIYTTTDYQPFKIESGEDIDLAEETNCIGDASVYQPILLTAEILEKNKFRKSKLMGEQRHFTYFLDSGLELLAIYDADFSIVIGQSSWYIKYVHQLQHLLRLCHIEKEIIL